MSGPVGPMVRRRCPVCYQVVTVSSGRFYPHGPGKRCRGEFPVSPKPWR